MSSRAAPRSAQVPTSLALVGDRIAGRVDELLAGEQVRWSAVDSDLERPLEALRAFIAAGGKRLRPAFCFWAFVGAGGDPDDPVIIDAGGALELLHTFAIIHDDVMDGSQQRRNHPTLHTAFEDDHRQGGWRGEARRFGEGAAVLVGDLAAMYGDHLLRAVPPRAYPVFDQLRIELCAGQYLDLAGAVRGTRHPRRAARIERYKAGKYTVERPLHLGAAVAGRLEALAGSLSAVGLPLGDAFQLRDDLLGVFGDPETTGKPVGDDLRDGKLTPLLAAGVERAAGRRPDPFARVGAPDLDEGEIRALQDFLIECGAVSEIEEQIANRLDAALDALGQVPIAAEARHALRELALYVAWRDR